MRQKRSFFSKSIEVLLVILTFITHWLIFYFVIITACKTTEEAARLTLAFRRNGTCGKILCLYFNISTMHC